jgi:hypothetical protein
MVKEVHIPYVSSKKEVEMQEIIEMVEENKYKVQAVQNIKYKNYLVEMRKSKE